MSTTKGKASVAVVGALVAASGLGVLPVGQFFWKKAPPSPKPPIDPGSLEITKANPSRGKVRVGPLTIEGILGQSKLVAGEDGTVFVDVKVTAAEAKEQAERRPVDLALVLDVSGSMAGENKITLMKEACRRLESQLGAQDRIAVIAFSTDARVLFPLQPLSDGDAARKRYLAAIDALVPTASTNIAGGLETGAAELKRSLRSGAARRLLLLTDGIANVGNCSQDGLVGLTRRLGGEGFSVSTVGLGLDYQASLLSSMGEAGGGNYHYVDNAARIAGIFDAEWKGLRSLVAKGVRVTLTPRDGAELVNVIEWNADRVGTEARINVGDLESGRSTKIVAQLRVPTGKSVTAEDVLALGLEAEDAKTGEKLAPSPLVLGVGITTSKEEALASVNLDAQRDLVAARDARDLENARKAAEKNDQEGVRVSLDAMRARGVKDMSFKAADGCEKKMSLEAFERACCAPAESSDRATADKMARSAAAAGGK